MPDTLVSVMKTQAMTNIDPTRSDKRQIVATVMANVANPTFLYNSPRMICSKSFI